MQESQFWKLYKEDQPRCSIVVRTSVGLVHILACLLEPFMPSFSLEVINLHSQFPFAVICLPCSAIFTVILAFKVFKQLNLSPEAQLSLSDEKGDIDRARRPWDIIPSGHKIGKPEPLFKELVCLALENLALMNTCKT